MSDLRKEDSGASECRTTLLKSNCGYFYVSFGGFWLQGIFHMISNGTQPKLQKRSNIISDFTLGYSQRELSTTVRANAIQGGSTLSLAFTVEQRTTCSVEEV